MGKNSEIRIIPLKMKKIKPYLGHSQGAGKIGEFQNYLLQVIFN